MLGTLEGDDEGHEVGTLLGTTDGVSKGSVVGILDGCDVGNVLGIEEGVDDGDEVGLAFVLTAVDSNASTRNSFVAHLLQLEDGDMIFKSCFNSGDLIRRGQEDNLKVSRCQMVRYEKQQYSGRMDENVCIV